MTVGRPVKDEHEKLSEFVRLRVTPDELLHVKKQAESVGLTVSEYLRRRACGYVVPAGTTQRSVDPALLSEMNKLGLQLKAVGNLANQLALSAHTKRRTRIVWQEVAKTIKERLEAFDEVLVEIASAGGADRRKPGR